MLLEVTDPHQQGREPTTVQPDTVQASPHSSWHIPQILFYSEGTLVSSDGKLSQKLTARVGCPTALFFGLFCTATSLPCLHPPIVRSPEQKQIVLQEHSLLGGILPDRGSHHKKQRILFPAQPDITPFSEPHSFNQAELTEDSQEEGGVTKFVLGPQRLFCPL